MGYQDSLILVSTECVCLLKSLNLHWNTKLNIKTQEQRREFPTGTHGYLSLGKTTTSIFTMECLSPAVITMAYLLGGLLYPSCECLQSKYFFKAASAPTIL